MTRIARSRYGYATYYDRVTLDPCPCGDGERETVTRHYPGGAHEPPSWDTLGTRPCPACGREDVPPYHPTTTEE